MPNLGGLDVLLRIKEIDPYMSVVMLTAFRDEATGIKTLKIGADGYITKPIDADYLGLSLMTKLEMIGCNE